MSTMRSVNATRWRILSPYLDEALDMPTGEWGRLITSICTRDASVAADLRVLLAERDAIRESRFLERGAHADLIARMPSFAGETFGGYQLVSRIGQGGMGTVWLAERLDRRSERWAAVKLLNISWLGHTAEQRFRREGMILARLMHPHIAHLIDAGVSAAGQPYLVLEHVDGQRIDRYCDEHSLGIDARLRLFLDVLDAVAHAHANLVVHRDIKPDNVLVSGTGQVKLLDFGIAKLLEGDTASGDWPGADTGALTREGGGVLTLKYAAPEQLTDGPVTAATDLYALGVLLYELLTGQHPTGPPSQSPATLVRAILETEPLRMSEAVVRRKESQDAVIRHATMCGTSRTELRRILQRDLDNIVAKTLKKNPRDRYASATALADDIRQYLERKPLRVRPAAPPFRTATLLPRRLRVLTALPAFLLSACSAIGGR